jgi:uncharacterized protein (UPF0297 family)
MARKIVITSGKGGVGKTTITANLGTALASLGQRVVMLDIDFGLNNLDVVMGIENNQNTITFNLGNDQEMEVRKTMLEVYNALKEKGYNPINQLVGYIMSEDPTYITTHNNARNLIRRIDRYTLLQMLVKYYLTH